MRQQSGDEFLLLNAAGFGLEHQAHGCVFARLIAHYIQHGQHGGFELGLLSAQRLLAGLNLGVGEFFNFFQHTLAAHAGWQLVHDQLPLATGQVFNHPTGTHFERATAGAIGIGNVRRAADDLTATRIVGAGQDLHQLVVAQLRALDEGHARIGHFTQVVAWNFCGHTHRDTACAVEQGKWQTGGQLLGLFGGAVVVGLEVDRAFVNLVQQQRSDFGQAGFGVSHGRSAIAITRAEVALAVDQGIALRKVLRHAHEGFVGGTVTVRVIAAQHVTDHAGALDGLGA